MTATKNGDMLGKRRSNPPAESPSDYHSWESESEEVNVVDVSEGEEEATPPYRLAEPLWAVLSSAAAMASEAKRLRVAADAPLDLSLKAPRGAPASPPRERKGPTEVLPRVPDVCEHFRKSLASFTMTNHNSDVEDHFKRALGADWKSKVAGAKSKSP